MLYEPEVSRALGVPVLLSDTGGFGGKLRYTCYYKKAEGTEFLHLLGDTKSKIFSSDSGTALRDSCEGGSSSQVEGREVRINRSTGTVCVFYEDSVILVDAYDGRGAKARPFSMDQYRALATAVIHNL